MLDKEDFCNAVDNLVTVRNMSTFVRNLVKTNNEFFDEIGCLIFTGIEEYEKKFPYKYEFKNGVYVNEDSEMVVYGINYAVNMFDWKKYFDCCPDFLLPTVRYLLADELANYYGYFVWNWRTTDYSRIYRLLDEGKNLKYGGKTIFY